MDSPKKIFREQFHNIFMFSEKFPFTYDELLSKSPIDVKEIITFQQDHNVSQQKALDKMTKK